ncbi:nucleoside/nucleotide kinase family protein [Streptomyces sp. NPDC091281]|uniref:nucleoside/nucleotide kinase family protein n=1 Tax=Streptomyces sp. NPDC091281 TaxID=3365985 RepID=UPI0038036F4B
MNTEVNRTGTAKGTGTEVGSDPATDAGGGADAGGAVHEGHAPVTWRYDAACLDRLTERALALAERPGRTLIGIAGEPGSGKSTLAEHLLSSVEARRPGLAAAVSMDGFHLAQRVIDARGHGPRKGAIDTFDAHGFVAALRRTRDETATTVWWPEFRRELEEPVAGAVEVAPAHRLVVVDGNFLLSTRAPWDQAAGLLTETWFLDADGPARRDRLTARYVRYGFTPEAARAKTDGVDEVTSRRIRLDAHRADLILTEGQ